MRKHFGANWVKGRNISPAVLACRSLAFDVEYQHLKTIIGQMWKKSKLSENCPIGNCTKNQESFSILNTK